MKTGMDVCLEKGLPKDQESWSFEEFAGVGLPPIVKCRDCEMSLAFPNAYVDAEGFTYCSGCAEECDDSGPEYEVKPAEPPAPPKEVPEDHECDPNESWPEHDALGIYLCRVCDICRDAKLSAYRPEILTGYTQADVDEPIEPDGEGWGL